MEFVAWDVAKGLAERGHVVKIITTDISRRSPCEIPQNLSNHLTVRFLKNTRPGRYSRAWWHASRSAYLFEKQHFCPDIIFSVSAGAMSVLPLLGEVPSVMQAHGTLLSEIRSKLRTGRLLSIASSIKNLTAVPRNLVFYRRLKTVAAVGPAVYNALRHPLIRLVLPENRIIMIPNGVDTELFKLHAGEKEKIRSQLSIPQNAKVLVWVSRLHRQKGAHLALNAFARLNRDDIWFLVIGDGPEKKKLQQQADEMGISDHVIFAGEVPHDCLPSFLSGSDAFLFTPIGEEGFALNVLEALSVNLPCIISQHLAKFIDLVEGVYPVQPRDIKGVVEGISKALCDRSDGRSSFIEAHYSKKLMLSRYEDLLKKACST
jgi:glycosyltransferase involved in cell wall biosynthesis